MLHDGAAMLNTSIEIHDSGLGSIAFEDNGIVLNFSEVYIHKSAGTPGVDDGTVWLQTAGLRVQRGVLEGSVPDLPCVLYEGYFTLGRKRSETCIPIPLSCEGPVEIHLTTEFGQNVVVRGLAAVLELLGEPRYVEEFPGGD